MKKTFTKTKIAMILPLVLSAFVNAQVQSQSTSSYETEPSSQNVLNYDIPPVSERSDLLEENTQVAVNMLELYEIVPQGSQARKELVTDSVINQKLSEFVNEFNGKISFNDLRRIANELTTHYRDSGELLTRVFIPAQTVKKGVFTLAVLKGTLGKVNVSGNESVEDSVFQSAFADQKGQVIQRDLAESALLRVQNLLPGVSSIGVFSPGDTLGQSDITIEVTDEERISSLAYIDNHGSAFTGEIRAGLHVELNNLFGIRDKLTLDVIANEEPEGDNPEADKCCNGGIKYEALTTNLKHSFGFELFRTTYDVGDVEDLELAAIQLSGESTRLRVFGNYHSVVSRSTTSKFTYGVSRVNAENFVLNPQTRTNITTSLDDLAEIDVGYQFTHFSDTGSVYFGRLGAVLEGQSGALSLPSSVLGFEVDANNPPGGNGLALPPSRVGANVGNSFRVTADLNGVFKLSDLMSLKVRANGQFSGDVLVPVQQLSLAGPTGVRAYPAGAYVADKGAVFSTDLIFNVSEYGSVSLFVDVAHGQKNAFNNLNQEPTADLAGYGIGLALKYNNSVNFNLSAAWAHDVEGELTLGQGGREAAGRDEPQIYGSFSVKF